MVPRIPNTLCHPLAARRVTERIQPDEHTPLGRMPWPCGSTQADCVLCSSSALGSAIVQCRAHWYRIPRERIRPFRSVRACWRPCHHQSCGWGKPRPMRSAHTPRVARCPEGPHWTPTSSRYSSPPGGGGGEVRKNDAGRSGSRPAHSRTALALAADGTSGSPPRGRLGDRRPDQSRFVPHGQKGGSCATCAHESAEGHRLGGVRQRSAPWL